MSSLGDSKSGGGGGMGGMNMVTTAMAFSVSACFVLFVFTRLLCARLHLRAGAAADQAAAGDAFALQAYNVERGISGLEPTVVRSFPTVKLGDGAHRPGTPVEEESQCTVCLEEYAAKDVVRVLPACGHAFHAPCIDAWLRQHPTCPVCRASLRAKTNQRATPLDYDLAAGARAPPASQVPASSSDLSAASPLAAAAIETGMEPAGRMEIVPEEPAFSGDQSPAVPAAAGNETARQSASSVSGPDLC